MNWTIVSQKRAKLLAHASLALGLWIAPVLSAAGAEYQRPCPPVYRCPPGYYNYNQGAPQAPRMGVDGQPLPADASPSDGQATDGQTDAQGQAQADQQQQFPQAQDFNAAQASSSRASLAPGADTPQLGRLDQANRLNLFDNMTAAPQSKLWFGYQYSSGINTGIDISPGFTSFIAANSSYFSGPLTFAVGDLPPGIDLDQVNAFLAAQGQPGLNATARQRQNNYRVGAEIALSDDFSVAIQGQYYQNLVDDSGYGDDWSQPQILLKQVLASDYDTILSATLGILPETGVDTGDFEDNTTRLYPGMLFYETLSPDVFTQGGFQFGIPTREDQVYTFDWSLSLGFWLYQDPSLNSCCDCCSGGLIQGIIPQVGILGKHVIGDNTRAGAFGFQGSSSFIFNGSPVNLPEGFFIYNEPTDVVDLTVGTLFLVDRNIQVGVGYSFPLTDSEVRQDEFLSYVNYLF